jgi:mRNA-degrading endonuclease RelE of RelBE toxin-antitoxin system
LLQHRRLIVGNYKIIYLIEDDVVYISDIFDTRQDPKKMNG